MLAGGWKPKPRHPISNFGSKAYCLASVSHDNVVNEGIDLFRFCCRLAGMLLLALVVVLAMLDITRSITASSIVMTPLAESWVSISPASFEAAKQGVETWTMSFVWDPLLLSVLKLPSWLILGLLSVLLFWLGQHRSAGFGRFASN